MTDVHWIKLSTDLFENRKIKYLRRLPEGDSLALIWVMLLTLAGRCSADGTIFLAENVPYTPEILADELGFEEHQSLEKLEKIREQTKARVARYRTVRNGQDECNAECNVTDNVTVTQCNAECNAECNVTDSITVTQCNAADKNRIEENREEEKRTEEREENAPGESANTKKPKAFVPPTVEEVRQYCLQRKSGVDPVRFWEYFDTGGWKDSEGKPVRNWKQKLITWETHGKEKGKEQYDSRGIFSNGVSEWDNCYTFDGRTL